MADHESELAEAVKNSQVEVMVAGRKLRLHKWTWRQSMTHGDKFIGTIAQVLKGKSAADVLKKDVLDVLRDQAEIMATILVDTIIRDNFEDRNEATEWFDTIGLDDAVTLLGHVMRQNYVPLKDAFSELKRVVIGESSETKISATK